MMLIFHWSNVALSLFIPILFIETTYDDVFSLIQYRRFLILCLRFKVVSKLLTIETTIRDNVKYYIDYRKPMTPGLHTCTGMYIIAARYINR